LSQARNVHRAVGVERAQVKLAGEQPLRGVDVGIDYERAEVELSGFGRNREECRIVRPRQKSSTAGVR
jgi:hypothetical protein